MTDTFDLAQARQLAAVGEYANPCLLAAALARVARLEAAARELLTGVLPTPSEARCTVYTDDVKDLRAALEREP